MSIIDDGEWEMVGDESEEEGIMYEARDRLLATVYVNSCPCHLEGIRVVERGDDGIRRAANPSYDELIDLAAGICGDGNFQTATITVDGEVGEYVIMATSFAD